MTLFKYMKLKYLSDALEFGAHASELGSVNDLYEEIGVENTNNYRIVCMTNSPKKMLLWAYYVNHRGCCVEYEIPESWEQLIEKVQYDKDFVDRSEMDVLEIIEALKHKGSEWEHENEYRAIYYAPNSKGAIYWQEIGNNIFLNLPVKSVIFGVNSQMDSGYIDAIRTVQNHNKSKGAKVLINKLKRSPYKYELVYDRQWDVIEELKKYK